MDMFCQYCTCVNNILISSARVEGEELRERDGRSSSVIYFFVFYCYFIILECGGTVNIFKSSIAFNSITMYILSLRISFKIKKLRAKEKKIVLHSIEVLSRVETLFVYGIAEFPYSQQLLSNYPEIRLW